MTPNTDTTTETRTRTTSTDDTRTTEQRYTCTENTGTAAVPDLRRKRSDRDEREDMDEQIWSHRL